MEKTLLMGFFTLTIIIIIFIVFVTNYRGGPLENVISGTMKFFSLDTKTHKKSEVVPEKDELTTEKNDSDSQKKEEFFGDYSMDKGQVTPKNFTVSQNGLIDGVENDLFSQIPSNYYFLDDGAEGEMSVQHNMCSKSCCSAQWPVPFKQKNDPFVCGNKDELVPSNIMCNNSFQDSGCLCLTKKQSQFLMNRGTNGREWF